MPDITEAELKKQIKSGAFARVYLLYGTENYLTRFYAEKIAEKAVTELPDLNLHQFDAAARAEEIVSACEALPVMSGLSCVMVCDYPFDTAAAGELDQLKGLLGDPPESCVLVFWYNHAAFSQKSAKSKAIAALIRKAGCVLPLDRREEGELAQLLVKRAARQGCTLQPTTARYLISLCGADLANLFSELDKLCVYVGNAAITNRDVDAVAVKTVDASVFLLARAVSANNPDRAFGLIDELFAQRAEPTAILGALASAYVDMYRAKAAEAAGLRAESIADDFGYGRTAFRLKNGAAAARKVSVSTLRDCLAALRRADLALKTSAADSRIILEQTVMRLMLLMSA